MANIAYYFLEMCQKLQKLWHLNFFLNTRPYRAGNFKTLLLQQVSIQTLWGHGLAWRSACSYGAHLLLIWSFKVSKRYFSNSFHRIPSKPGKPKMWNISKTADDIAIRKKNLGLGVLQCIYVGYFSWSSLEFDLVSFGALRKMSNFTIFKTPLLQFSSKFIQALYKVS